MRERFPAVRLVESENRGLAAGWNRGVAETSGEYVLILNADAWLVGDAAERLVDAADRHPRAALVGPRLRNPDGSLQRSVRGFPTLWRLATEYLYLRKLAPRSQALNAFYAGGFAHDAERTVEWVMGSCMLVRRAAFEEVGPFDERYFLFSEEVDWMRRATDRGWSCRLHADGRVRPRRRRRARRQALSRERPRAPAVPLAPRAARARPSTLVGSCAPRCSCEGGCIAASARVSTARWGRGSARATSRR